MTTGPLIDLALIELEYFTDTERHSTRLHVRPIALTPTTGFNNYAYVTPPTAFGFDLTILDTFTQYGVRWASYYPPDWTLAFRALWVRSQTIWTPLALQPIFSGILGTASDVIAPGQPTVRRVFHLQSIFGGRRRLWLRQLSTRSVAPRVGVGIVSGGYDPRDQEMLAYLSGDTTAILAPDGRAFLPAAELTSWWDRPLG